MKRQTKLFFTLTGLLLALVLLLGVAGTAFAHAGDTPGTTGNNGQSHLQQMQEWMGPQAWGQMIQHMTQVHGPEATGQMLQQMNEGGPC
ncbi:hypothetical protein RY27_07135, partial [Litorilinea aerophila]